MMLFLGGFRKSPFQHLFGLVRLGRVILLDDMTLWLFVCLYGVLIALRSFEYVWIGHAFQWIWKDTIVMISRLDKKGGHYHDDIDTRLIVAKNLDDPFHDHHTSVTLSNKTKPLSPKSKQNDDINLLQIEANSESKVNTCAKIGSSLALVKNLDNPFHDNHTCPTHSFNTKLLSPPSSNQNACTNLSQSETNSESKIDTCPKTSNTLAVVINSDDPFQDFKKSMLQMISEKEIYSSEDLEELLNYFLKLNSPSHHYIISQAFMEILNND
ncbi:Transcription repressor OFP6 [Capsicum chinense]|nr:Transcription repressor OFP6 [Capsicum chinense]